MSSQAKRAMSVDDAVIQAGNGRFHSVLTAVVGMCSASAVMEILSPSYLLPAASCDLQLDTTQKSMLGAAAFIGMILGTHFWGLLADTRGRLLVMRTSLLGDVLVGLVSAFLPNAWLFISARFITGFLVGAPTSTAMAYLGEFHTEKTRAKAIVLVALYPGAATLVLAGLAYLVLPLDLAWELPWVTMRSWRLFVLLNVLPALVTGLSLFWFPESPRFLVAVGRPDLARRSLANVYAFNTGDDPEGFPVSAVLHQAGDNVMRRDRSMLVTIWEQTAPLLKPPLLGNTSLVCIIMFAVVCSCNGFIIWLPELFNRMSLYAEMHPNVSATACMAMEGVVQDFSNFSNIMDDASESMLLRVGPHVRAVDGQADAAGCVTVLQDDMFINTAILGTANIIMPFIGMCIVNFLGNKLLLTLSVLLAGACGVLLNTVPSTTAVLFFACGLISITSMCVSIVISIAVNLYPTSLRAMAVSLTMMSGRLGSMSGNFFFGVLLETQCAAAFWSLGGLLLACGCLSFLLPKRGEYAK